MVKQNFGQMVTLNLKKLYDEGQKRKLDEIHNIIIHCSDSNVEDSRQVCHDIFDIDLWHRARGYCCVGYHYVITYDGTIQLGRPLEFVGAHTLHWNSNSIGICYVGGRVNNCGFVDTRTPQQKHSLQLLLTALCSTFDIRTIHGHRDFNPKKNCPCFDAHTEYLELCQMFRHGYPSDENIDNSHLINNFKTLQNGK